MVFELERKLRQQVVKIFLGSDEAWKPLQWCSLIYDIRNTRYHMESVNWLLAISVLEEFPRSSHACDAAQLFRSFLFLPALPAITMHQTWISTGSCSTRGPCCLSTWSLQTSCSAKDFRPWCQSTTLWKEWVQETTVNTILLICNKTKLIPSLSSSTTAWGKLLGYKELLHIFSVEMNSGSLQHSARLLCCFS